MTELTDSEKAAWKCPACGDGLFANGCMSCKRKLEPGQRAYEVWKMDYEGCVTPVWDDLGPGTRSSWAAVEQACAVPSTTTLKAETYDRIARLLHLGPPDVNVANRERMVEQVKCAAWARDQAAARASHLPGLSASYDEMRGLARKLAVNLLGTIAAPGEQRVSDAEAAEVAQEVLNAPAYNLGSAPPVTAEAGQSEASAALADAMGLAADHPQRGNLSWLVGVAVTRLEAGQSEAWVRVLAMALQERIDDTPGSDQYSHETGGGNSHHSAVRALELLAEAAESKR